MNEANILLVLRAISDMTEDERREFARRLAEVKGADRGSVPPDPKPGASGCQGGDPAYCKD
jgi:hypothetical protein